MKKHKYKHIHTKSISISIHPRKRGTAFYLQKKQRYTFTKPAPYFPMYRVHRHICFTALLPSRVILRFSAQLVLSYILLWTRTVTAKTYCPTTQASQDKKKGAATQARRVLWWAYLHVADGDAVVSVVPDDLILHLLPSAKVLQRHCIPIQARISRF